MAVPEAEIVFIFFFLHQGHSAFNTLPVIFHRPLTHSCTPPLTLAFLLWLWEIRRHTLECNSRTRPDKSGCERAREEHEGRGELHIEITCVRHRAKCHNFNVDKRFCFFASFSKAFPRKSSVTRTPRAPSDSDIQGSKDAVIQDLERKLRFKEERISNGQQVCVCVCVCVFNYSSTETAVCRQLWACSVTQL